MRLPMPHRRSHHLLSKDENTPLSSATFIKQLLKEEIIDASTYDWLSEQPLETDHIFLK